MAGRPVQRERLKVPVLGRCGVRREVVVAAKSPQDVALTCAVADLAVQRERLLQLGSTDLEFRLLLGG